MNKISLDFSLLKLNAELFNSKIAEAFFSHLPYEINLTLWGTEAHGSIDIDLGEDNPEPIISAGGLAYTNQGNYLCIFFGQRPTWAIEYIGRITWNNWNQLIGNNKIILL
ncbi:MAG TPA: hypothetical protein DC057_02575 [Spirochaetia bacterium]|nr:hypothetical protein [Spirochaetia bacterium]